VMTIEPEPLSSIVSGVPPRLEALVMSALSQDAEKRPRSADQMMDVIESFADKASSIVPRRSERPMPLMTKKRPVNEPAPAVKKPQKLELVAEATVPPAGGE